MRLSTLTESQFNHSVFDILQVSAAPMKGLGQGLDDVTLEQRASIASSVAANAAANLPLWSPCTPSEAAPAACERAIIDTIGTKLYRRPLVDAERSEMTKLFDAGIAEKDFSSGVEWFLTGVLQSPYFVYQVVRPDPAEAVGDARALSPLEYAARLSYFVWDGPPDDALMASAVAGDLADVAKRDAQLARLMTDARFQRGVEQFYTRWLNLDAFRELARDVPAFTESVAADLSKSLLLSATELYKADAPSISSLFSGDTYFLNDNLRKFYGVSGSGDGLTATSMPGESRRGLMTHPALMALLARPEESFPIGRGLFLLRNVLCQVVPAPPPGLVIPEQPPLMAGVSTRERLEAHTGGAVCQGCHSMINPAGFALESFDEVGRYRALDHGKPTNTSGTLTLGIDVDGTFARGDELLAKVAESHAVRACFAEKYLSFALAHSASEQPLDSCSVQSLGQAFEASGDLKRLVVSVATSDSFRMRLGEGVGQ